MPTAIDPQVVVAVLRAHPQTFGADAPAQEAYIKEVEARLGTRSTEDKREAAKLVVETAKMLITIAVGVLVATFAWMQYARTNGLAWISWPMVPFYFVSLLLVASMILGFWTISGIFRRAAGSDAPTEPAWEILHVAGRLNFQSYTGVLALLFLFFGVWYWGLIGSIPKPAVSVVIAGSSTAAPPTGSLSIEGTWTDLRLKTAANQEIKLPQQNSPVTVTCQ